MAKNIVESIFVSKNNLSALYPNLPNVKNFDMERKHLLYGRIDKDGDAISLDDGQIRQIPAGKKTEFAVNFVCDAFKGLRGKVRQAFHGGILSRKSPYATDLKVYKAWRTGDIEYSYNQYLNKLYVDFVGNYLEIDRRHERIKSFEDFTKEFMRYILRIVYYFPITKTGFTLSNHCSPFISGLMLEIAPEQHGVEHNLNIIKYIGNDGPGAPAESKERRGAFKLFVREANKHGFMVDKNAPWRLVFNISSGVYNKEADGSLAGAHKYMSKYAVGYENILNTYYSKTHLQDLVNLKKKLQSLYDSFYEQYGTYETIKYVGDPQERCTGITIINERKGRASRPIILGSVEQQDEYWLKILLKLRMAETLFPHTIYNFNFYEKEMINLYRLFNRKAALKYINNLTKGFQVTKFIRRGDFWYGSSEAEYERRKLEAIEKAYDADRVQYSLTGTKNIVK